LVFMLPPFSTPFRDVTFSTLLLAKFYENPFRKSLIEDISLPRRERGIKGRVIFI